MGKLTVSRRPSRVPQVGDMRDRISLYSRAITTPTFGSANFRQSYTLIATVWTSIETVDSPIVFTKTDTEREISIIFKIRYRSDVNQGTIVKYGDDNYEILKDPNLDKRSRFMFLKCALMGDSSLEVNR